MTNFEKSLIFGMLSPMLPCFLFLCSCCKYNWPV